MVCCITRLRGLALDDWLVAVVVTERRSVCFHSELTQWDHYLNIVYGWMGLVMEVRRSEPET